MTDPSEEVPAFAPRPGLQLLVDVFIAPHRAFATIAATAQWVPAALIAIAVSVIAAVVLIAPAYAHLDMVALRHAAAAAPPSAATAKRLAEPELLRIVRLQLGVAQFSALFFTWVWTALILSTLSRHGPRGFPIYFALAVNVTLPSALENLIAGLAVAARPPEFYGTWARLVLAFPDSLAALRPGGVPQEIQFLSSFSVGALWSALLLAYGLHYIGGVRLVVALSVSFGLAIAFALAPLILPLGF